jgi:hypothetical protein
MSLPVEWNDSVCEALNVDAVLPSNPPTEGVGTYQTTTRNGVEQNSDGDWVEAWQIVDLFTTEQAEEYNRNVRNGKLAETDWWALSDQTITEQQRSYRQALRDITDHENWPFLEDSDWPTEP